MEEARLGKEEEEIKLGGFLGLIRADKGTGNTRSKESKSNVLIGCAIARVKRGKQLVE